MEFLRSKKLEKYSESFENNDYDDLDFIESKTEVKSNQIKEMYSFTKFLKFWDILTKIKWLNIYIRKSCVGRRLVRKPYINQDRAMQR